MTATATASLWDLGDELLVIEAMIAEADGELTEEIEARLDALEGSFFDKVERIALLIEERAGDGEKAKGQEERLRGIRRFHENTVKRLKEYLERVMGRAGIDKVERPNARVRRYRNSQPSVVVTVPVEELPEGYRTVIPAQVVVNRDAILEDFKAGAKLPEGVEIVYGFHVRVL